MPKSPKKLSKLPTGTKDNYCSPTLSLPHSWYVGDKEEMIRRRSRKLAETGVKCCPFCGGSIWRINDCDKCGDHCQKI